MSTTLRKAAAVGGIALTLSLSAGAGSAHAMRGPDDGGRSSSDQKVADADGHVYISVDGRGVRQDVPAGPATRVLPAPNGVPGWMAEAVGGSALAAAAGLVVVAAARRRSTHLHSPA